MQHLVYTENGQPRTIEPIRPSGYYGIRLRSEVVLTHLRSATMALVLPTSNEGKEGFGPRSGNPRGPYPLNRGPRHQFPHFCHLLGFSYRPEQPGIQGYQVSLNRDGAIGLLEFEEHLPSNGENPFALRLNIAPTTIDGENLAVVDYYSSDPNMEIVPDSPNRWQTAQGAGELVVSRATRMLADISSHLRRDPVRQEANPFKHGKLQRLYDHVFPPNSEI